MTINPHFNNFNHANTQNLLNELVIESIKIHGINCYYLPRERGDQLDQLYKEDSTPEYNSYHPIEMYITSDSFGGEGELLSKFSIEIRDTLNLAVARDRFEDVMRETMLSYNDGRLRKINEDEYTRQRDLFRPIAGDLIYFPLNKKMFEIKFVEHEENFYPFGSLQFYTLSTELFEYSQHKFGAFTGDRNTDVTFNEFITMIDTLNSDEYSLDPQSAESILTLASGETLYTSTGDRILLFEEKLDENPDDPEDDRDIFDREAEDNDIINWDANHPFGNEVGPGGERW